MFDALKIDLVECFFALIVKNCKEKAVFGLWLLVFEMNSDFKELCENQKPKTKNPKPNTKNQP
jgi:hypothetical protein